MCNMQEAQCECRTQTEPPQRREEGTGKPPSLRPRARGQRRQGQRRRQPSSRAGQLRLQRPGQLQAPPRRQAPQSSPERCRQAWSRRKGRRRQQRRRWQRSWRGFEKKSDEQAAEQVVSSTRTLDLMLLLFWRAFLDGPARGGLHSNHRFTFHTNQRTQSSRPSSLPLVPPTSTRQRVSAGSGHEHHSCHASISLSGPWPVVIT